MSEHARNDGGKRDRQGRGRDGAAGAGARPGGDPARQAADLLGTILGSVRYAADGPAAEDAVEAGASMLAAAAPGWEAMSAAVVTAAVDAVRRCWAGGWQPADLERIVRRDAPDAATAELVVDAVAAEEARRPGASGPARDPRWRAQLDRLDARVWWGADPAYLDALTARRRATRFETACDVLTALRLLARLPRITPLPAPPGPSGPSGGSGPGGAPASRMLGRIRGLLAKAEATTFAEEAEALSAKAQELMARHSIDEALLTHTHGPGGNQPADGPSAIRIGIEGPYEQGKALLLDAVAAANRCQAVWAAELGFSTAVGFPPDLEATELLYTSLLLQATAAMHRAADEHHARGRSRRTRDFRQTFLVAYADRIRTRLSAATAAATAAASAEAAAADRLLPVLAARELAVEETTGTLFPDTAPVRLRGIRDAAGWDQGTAAADHARLDPTRRPGLGQE
ncbi:DUF2786 domain-containing protein [Streptomyces noursei]|uniref:DUF2786 domain-containing protein n=1 Tax=Streptomyces noursei TaxID=1971 RepID=UPI00196486B8|nr:DUF2786 domain-containing protein [Streptomyces noursei]QRX93980.1 DUF2786 domain-containing protein [Streptomyces noursei]